MNPTDHRPRAFELTLDEHTWNDLEEAHVGSLVAHDQEGQYQPTDALMLYCAGIGNEALAMLAVVQSISRPTGLVASYVLLSVKVVATRDENGWD